jgi:2,4-dienoyl-CoA reductase-like NADH-dependent reductase (Old Yellow Enzyme family)
MRGLPWWEKPLGRIVLGRMVGKYDLQEGYNLEAAQMVKPAVGKVPVLLVGGLRRASHMDGILQKGYADFISMSRPFIREPFLVKRIREGKTSVASCISCNKCLAALANEMPARCYSKGLAKGAD